MSERIRNQSLKSKVMSAEEAVQFINNGDMIGTSGFTGAGYPKGMPAAIAAKANEAHARGDEWAVKILTGASTAPENDGVLAEADAVSFRSPFNTDPKMRAKINEGKVKYTDIHLSELGMYVQEGFFGHMDVAIIEAVAIREDGSVVPSSAVGNNVEYMDAADRIIIEINEWQDLELEGMHDIYRMPMPGSRVPLPICNPGDRIGGTSIDVEPEKIVAIVHTDGPDRNAPFRPVDETSKAIAGHLLDFLDGEVHAGRLAYDRLILQNGVGNVPNAVLAGLEDSKFENITAYTEVIQDGMLDLIDSGKMSFASATSFCLSPDAAHRMNQEADRYRNHIVLRPQQVSNHPEVIRRLAPIGINGMIEADIYGNVNSTNVAGSKMMNGIGGSGDFTRNAYISSFVTPSVAKDGDISAIVPFASHIDHAEHDVKLVVTERGYADLRGLCPRDRVRKMIDIAAPEYRPLLEEYVEYASKSKAQHTPHDLTRAFEFHTRFLETGSMKK